MTRKPAKRPRMPQRVMARSMQPANWTAKTYLQWLPVISVAVLSIIGYTHLQDDVSGLKSAKPVPDFTIQITHLEDNIAVNASAVAELKGKEAADYVDLRQQIWQRNNPRQP